MKKSRNQIKTISLFAVIALLVGITGFKLVRAYYGDAKVVVEGNYIEASQGGSDMLGGSVHNTMEDFSEGISVDGNQVLNGFGEWTGDKGRLVYGEYHMPFTEATTSAGVLVGDIDGIDSQTIYVYDAYYVITGSATTTVEILLGTSTKAYITHDEQCGIDGSCGSATANEASILRTGNITGSTATSTIYSKLDFQGTDTRDASGTRYVVPVAYTDYLTMYASTTPATNRTDIEANSNLFDGYSVFKFFYLK